MTDTPAVNAPTDKEYTEIIKSDVDVDSTYTKGEGKPAKILYYCQECKQTVAPKRVGKKLSFKCSNCDNPIAFGTESSVANYYNVK